MITAKVRSWGPFKQCGVFDAGREHPRWTKWSGSTVIHVREQKLYDSNEQTRFEFGLWVSI